MAGVVGGNEMLTALLFGVALVVSYELWAAVTQRRPTISEYVWAVSKQHPSVPFALGFLCGHLFG